MLGLNRIPRTEDDLIMGPFRSSIKAYIKDQWKKSIEIWIDNAMDSLGGFKKIASWFETTNPWNEEAAGIAFHVQYERGKEARLSFSGNVLANSMRVFGKSIDREYGKTVNMDQLMHLKDVLKKEFEDILK